MLCLEGLDVYHPLEAAHGTKSENSIELMESRLATLGPKLGAVLFQLPPQFSKNGERLDVFLRMLLSETATFRISAPELV